MRVGLVNGVKDEALALRFEPNTLRPRGNFGRPQLPWIGFCNDCVMRCNSFRHLGHILQNYRDLAVEVAKCAQECQHQQ